MEYNLERLDQYPLEDLVTIELFGRPFSFKADSEVTRPQEIADFLSAEVGNVQSSQIEKGERISELAIVILTALNITNSKFEMKRRSIQHGNSYSWE